MRTIVGSSNKNTKDIKKAERIVNLDKNISAVPTNVSQYGAGGSDIKELETAKHWASEAEKSANKAESSANKAEDFMDKTIEAAEGIEENLETSHEYLEEIKAISKKIDGQETNIDALEKSTVTNAAHAAADAKIASDSAAQARTSEANAAASASSANNSAVSAKESEQAAFLSKEYAIAAATEGHQILAQTEAVYDKTIDDVSQAVQSYLKDKGGFDPAAGLPQPDSWFDIFGVEKKLSCLWTADVAGTIPETGVGFNAGDILIYNAIVDRYGRFSGELVTGGGGGGPTEFFNDIKLSADKRLLGTDSKGSTVELIKLTNDIVEAGDKTKPMHILAKDPRSAFVCIANSSTSFDNYQIYHEGNKPTPGVLGAYTKTEVDDKFVDLAGTKTMTGPLSTTNSVYIKSKEVYHPGNKPPASDLDAVSLTKNETITGQKKFTKTPIIEGITPQLSLTESDTGTEVIVKVESKKLTMATATSTPFDVDFNNSSVVMSNPKAKGAQGTTADALVRKDYADAELAKKLNHTGNGTLTGDLVVTGKITVEGTGSIFRDINTTGQVKENNIRVYSPANKPNAIDVGALPISGGSVGGALHVVGNITTDGTISEKGQRVYSPNNKPTPAALGAVNKAGDTMTGDLLLTHASATPLRLTRTSGDNLNIQFTTGGKNYFFGTGSDGFFRVGTTNNLITNGTKIYHEGFKPTAADVGAIGIDNVYNKAQSDERFWQRTETVNRAFSADATNAYTKSASDFKDVSNFRSFTSTTSTTGWDGSAGSGIFQGRMSGALNYGWAFYNDHASNLISFGKQKSDGSGFDWYKMYHAGNKPSAGDIGTYTKSEIDSKDNLKLNLTGGTITGDVIFSKLNSTTSGTGALVLGSSRQVAESSSYARRLTVYPPYHTGGPWHLGVEDTNTSDFVLHYGATLAFRLKSGGDLWTRTQGTLYGTGNRPSAVDVGALPITGGTLTGKLFGTNVEVANEVLVGTKHKVGISPSTTANEFIFGGFNDGATGSYSTYIRLGAGRVRFSPSSGTQHEMYHAGNLLFSKTPDVNKLAQRTDTGAVQATAFASPGDFRVTLNPSGGQKTGGASETGSIKVTLPRWKTATMMKVYISVYNYVSDTSFDVVASGYDYSDGVWHNCSAVITGGSATTNHPVYFGHDGSKPCIWIGSVGAKWAHPKIVVNKIESGYSGGDHDGWASGWNISFVTALGTVSRTISDTIIKPGGANVPADEQPTANTLVKRNASGNIAAKGRILLASTNDSDVGAGTASLDFVSSAGNVYGQIGDIDNTANIGLKVNNGRFIVQSTTDMEFELKTTDTGPGPEKNPRINFNRGDNQDVRIRFNSHDSERAPFGLVIERGSNNGSTTLKSYLQVEGEIYADKTQRVYHQGFKPTAVDVSALPLTGGGMSGGITWGNTNTDITTGNAAQIRFNSGLALGSYSNIKIFANTDATSGDTEYVHISAANGVAPTTSQGLIVANTYMKFNNNEILNRGNAGKGIGSFTKDFTVGGDANTYYPVQITTGLSQQIRTKVQIWRNYNEAGPSWNTSTHKGGGTLAVIINNSGGWGGAQYNWSVEDFQETYTTVFSGAQGSVTQRSFIVWVRGGGAAWHITSESYGAVTATVHLNGYTDDTTTYAPKTSADSSSIRSRWCVRNNTVYDSDVRVYSPNNKPTPAALGAVNKAGDTMTGQLINNIAYGYKNLVSSGWSYIGLASGSNEAHIAFNNTAVDGGIANSLHLRPVGSSAGSLVIQNNAAMKHQTTHGWVTIGSENSNHCHYSTDRPNHWFNKEVKVNGEIYCGASYAQRVYHTGNKPSAVDVGALPLSGGTLTGRTVIPLVGNNATITSLTNAPIFQNEVNIGTTSQFIPFGHQQARHNGGYRTHLNFGLYKSNSGWGEGVSGMYVALGGNDSYPTEHFTFCFGGGITHSKGYTYYHTGNKPSAADVGALQRIENQGHLVVPEGRWWRLGGNDVGLIPYAPNTTASSYLGTSAWVFRESWVHNYRGGNINVTDVIKAKEFRGNANVAGTGEAIHCPAGIYSLGTNWLYGQIITNSNAINAGSGAITCGSLTASGNVTAYSDRRVKDNIKNIPNALEKVMKLNGVTYTRTDQEDKEKLHTGVIAQEVEAVLPEAVITSENGDIKDFKSVAYGNLVGLLIEAIKELKQEIEELKCKK